MMYRKPLRWWHHQCIIRRLIDQLQWRLRLVVEQQLWPKRLHCFRQHFSILLGWIQQMIWHIRMYRLQRCMGRLILIPYRRLQHIRRHSPSNHHRIHCFRMMLSNQLIVIQRSSIRSLKRIRSCILPLIRWLRRPSMNHIVLDSWLGWRHQLIPSQLWLVKHWLILQLGQFPCCRIIIESCMKREQRILLESYQRIHLIRLLMLILGQHWSLRSKGSWQRMCRTFVR